MTLKFYDPKQEYPKKIIHSAVHGHIMYTIGHSYFSKSLDNQLTVSSDQRDGGGDVGID